MKKAVVPLECEGGQHCLVNAKRLVFLEPHRECLMSVVLKQRSCNWSVWFCLKSTVKGKYEIIMHRHSNSLSLYMSYEKLQEVLSTRSYFIKEEMGWSEDYEHKIQKSIEFSGFIRIYWTAKNNYMPVQLKFFLTSVLQEVKTKHFQKYISWFFSCSNYIVIYVISVLSHRNLQWAYVDYELYSSHINKTHGKYGRKWRSRCF